MSVDTSDRAMNIRFGLFFYNRIILPSRKGACLIHIQIEQVYSCLKSFFFLCVLFSSLTASHATSIEHERVYSNNNKGVVLEVISGNESVEDTLIIKQKTWILSIPGQSISLSFYGYSCSLDESLKPDNVENKISNVIERIEIKVGESNYEYKMLPYPARGFDIKRAVSPNNKWLILPNTSSKVFVVFPLFEDNFETKPFQLYCSLAGTKLHNELLGWQDDDTIMMRVGLSGDYFSVLYNLKDSQYRLEHPYLIKRFQVHKKTSVELLISSSDR